MAALANLGDPLLGDPRPAGSAAPTALAATVSANVAALGEAFPMLAAPVGLCGVLWLIVWSNAFGRGTVGRPMPHTELVIADEHGHSAPTGAVGEIRVHGYNVMLGYDGQPEATAETVDADGWLHTGDLGVLDDRGYLRVEGRLKDMVIRGGENIYPREIEAVLVTTPTSPTPRWWVFPTSTGASSSSHSVRPAEGVAPDVDGLRAHVRAELAHLKVPVHWEVVDGYPMTPTGKIKKFRAP